MASHVTYHVNVLNTADDYANVQNLDQPEHALIERVQIQAWAAKAQDATYQLPLDVLVAWRLQDYITGGEPGAFSANPFGALWDEANVIDWVSLHPIAFADGVFGGSSQQSYWVTSGHSGVYDVAHYVPTGSHCMLQVAVWNGDVVGGQPFVQAHFSARMWARHNIA